jgi:hypothetical protein
LPGGEERRGQAMSTGAQRIPSAFRVTPSTQVYRVQFN